MEQQQQQQQRGPCGFAPDRCAGCRAAVSTVQSTVRLFITSTTGSPAELIVPRGETVEGLRTRISQKFRVQTDRIVLLHNDRQLTTGKLLDFGVADDSRVTLVPVVESGLVCSTNRSERSLMDVLERLTEDQISDFLSGHSPLTINVGIGAHTMYVQLQLSAQEVKKLQQDGDVRIKSSSKHKSGMLMPGSVSHPDSDSAWLSHNATGSTISATTQSSSPALNTADSTAPTQPSIQRPTTTFNSKQPTSHSTTSVSAVKCHQSSLHQSCRLHSTHTSFPFPSTSALPSGCPHASCPVQAATPMRSRAPSGSIPGPLSPTPASTFTKSNVLDPPSTAEMCRPPGAVIESLVSHSPGIFSGTFSGTLAPCGQSGISHPRQGISIILQILSDLLRAASNHQGTPPTLLHCHSPTVNSDLTAKDTSREKSQPQVTQRVEHCNKPSGEESSALHSSTEENQTLHCKLEHLQFLMHQKRLRRRTRRSSHLSQTPHPYQRRQHRP